MRKKENIEKIYSASLKVFAEYGFRKTTVEDIAKQLNMTKGNLYLYAQSKKDLYQKTISWALLKWQGLVGEAIEKEEDVKKKFLVMCFKAVEYLSKDDNLRRVLVHDPDIFPMFPVDDPFHEINGNSILMIKSILVQGIEEKKFRKVDPDRISEVIFMIYKMFIIRTYIKAEKQVMEKMFTETVDLMTNGLFN